MPRSATARTPLLPRLATRLTACVVLGAAVLGCSSSEPLVANAADARAEAAEASGRASPTDPVETTGPSDAATESSTPADPCRILAEMTELERTAAIDPDDLPGIEALILQHSALLERMAPGFRDMAPLRDARLAAIVEEAAATAADFAEALRTAHRSNTAVPPDQAAEMQAQQAWMTEVVLELRSWEAEACVSVAGVTRGEINGIPHLHIEPGPNMWLDPSTDGN